jgi:hypothetical protein
MDAFVRPIVPPLPPLVEVEVESIYITFGKESEATPAQLKRIFCARYNTHNVFKQSWVDNRAKNNVPETYAFVLDVKGTNKTYNCIRCSWNASGLGKLKSHLQVPNYDLIVIVYLDKFGYSPLRKCLQSIESSS